MRQRHRFQQPLAGGWVELRPEMLEVRKIPVPRRLGLVEKLNLGRDHPPPVTGLPKHPLERMRNAQVPTVVLCTALMRLGDDLEIPQDFTMAPQPEAEGRLWPGVGHPG